MKRSEMQAARRWLHLLSVMVEMCRPWIAVSLIASVGWSYWYTSKDFNFGLLLASLSSLLLVGLGAFPLNDVHDLELDRVAHPHRPLPRMAMSIPIAKRLGTLMIAGGVATAVFLPLPATIAILYAGGLVVNYSQIKSKLPLIANIVTANLIAGTIVWPLLINGSRNMNIVVGLATVCFLFILAREIVKDIEDLEGDTAFDRVTLPVRLGVQNAYRTSAWLVRTTAVAIVILAWLSGNLASWLVCLPYAMFLLGLSKLLVDSPSGRASQRVGQMKTTLNIFLALWIVATVYEEVGLGRFLP